MQLPYDLVNKFAQVTVESPYAYDNKQIAEYGTIKKVNDIFLVQIDGSNIMTPFISVSDVRDEERVKVEVVGHQAIVTGNMTNPSVGVNTFNEEVDRIDGDMTDMDIQIHKDLADVRKEAEEERKKIKEDLEAAKKKAEEDAKEAYDHATAASKVSTDYIEAVPGQGFFVGAAKDHEHPYNVFINAAGIQIRHGYDSNATVLSKWDASQLVIGQSDKFHSTMKVNEFKISQNTIDFMKLDLTGMTLNDSAGVPYAKYGTTGFTLGYENKGTGVHLVGTNTAFQFYKEKTLLTEFALNRIQIGPNSAKNVVMDTNGIFLRNNTTNISKFTENSISFASGNGSIIYDASNTVDHINWNGDSSAIPGIVISSNNVTNAGLELSAKKDMFFNCSYGGTTRCYVLQRSTSESFSYNIYGTVSGQPRVNTSWVSYYGGSYGWNADTGKYYSRFEVRNTDWILFSNARWVTFRGDYTDSFSSSSITMEGFSVHHCDNISLAANSQATLKSESSSSNAILLKTGSSGSINCDCYDILYKGNSLWNIFALKDHTHASVASLYSTQLNNSAAITNLYENQLRQDEMITQLYEQTL